MKQEYMTLIGYYTIKVKASSLEEAFELCKKKVLSFKDGLKKRRSSEILEWDMEMFKKCTYIDGITLDGHIWL